MKRLSLVLVGLLVGLTLPAAATLDLLKRSESGAALTSTQFDANYTAIETEVNDAEIQCLRGVTSAADRLFYFTGSGTCSLATYTAAGRALDDDADNTAQRTTLGLGTIATQAANNVLISGGAITGITDITVADGGTGVSTLTGLAKGNGTSPFSAAAQGTDYYAPGGTDVAVADGGSGASTPAGARTNYGIVDRVLMSQLSCVPPATLGAAPTVRVGGGTPVEHVWQGWAFDGATDEMLDCAGIIPTWFSGDLQVKFWTVSSATANDMVFQVAPVTTNNFDIDGAPTYTYQSSGAVTTSGTAGKPTLVTVTITSAQHAFTAGDFVSFRIRRDADNTSATDSITANDVIVLDKSIWVEE